MVPSLTWVPEQRGSAMMPPETAPGAAVTPSQADSETMNPALGRNHGGFAIAQGWETAQVRARVLLSSLHPRMVQSSRSCCPRGPHVGKGKVGTAGVAVTRGRRRAEPLPHAPGRKLGGLKPLLSSLCSTDSSRARRGAKPSSTLRTRSIR